MENKKRISEITLIATSVLASVSISGGIIAILAHNWDDLSHSMRVFLSIMPILIGLTTFSYAYIVHQDSKIWMESASVFLLLMLGSSIGLIAQVYHMGGTFSRFLFYWMLFSIPIIYIGRSSAAAILYLAGITWWFLLEWFDHFSIWTWDSSLSVEKTWYWVLILGFVPHFMMNLKQNTYSLRSILLGWMMVVSFSFTAFLAFTTDHFFHTLFFLIMLYYFGKYYYGSNKSAWQRPLQSFAIFSIFSNAMYYTYKGNLHHVVYEDNYLNQGGVSHWTGGSSGEWYEYVLLYYNHLLLFVFAWLAYRFFNLLKQEGRVMNPVQFLFPFVLSAALVLQLFEFEISARVFLNIYLLLYAFWYIIHGMTYHISWIIVWAIIVLTHLLSARYFDMDIAFWIKGIVYISVGGMVLLFNKIYSEKMKI